MIRRRKTVNEIQNKVRQWSIDCFGEKISNDKIERNHRFLEESLELVQSLGCTKDECYKLVDYVFSRSVGEPTQEVGGTFVTLAALCNANDINLEKSAETEVSRITQPETMEKIRVKQANKPKNSPLPQNNEYPLNNINTDKIGRASCRERVWSDV